MIDIVSALLLGLGLIVHPCAAAPNIAAMSYISNSGGRTTLSLAAYVVGHTALYLILGGTLTAGARQADVAAWLQQYGGVGHHLLAVALLAAGIWLVWSARHHHEHNHQHHVLATPWGAMLSGAGIALLFCPEAAAMFFGLLIPMATASESAAIIIAIFALGTLMPMALFAWLLHTGRQHALARFSPSRTVLNSILGTVFIVAAAVMFFL